MSEFQLDSEHFQQRSQEILDMIGQLRDEVGLPEAIRQAIDVYVDDENHPELKRFGEVLLHARRQALLQQQLDDDRDALHSGRLNHDERLSTGRHYETLRREACEYNHLLRGLLESCGQYFSRDELCGWLDQTSQGRRTWVRGEVVGAVSEIALHVALQGLVELRGLRYASVDEDLTGFDFIASWQGRTVTVDAKTGLYHPLTEQKFGHVHLEISVPREVVHDFRITRRGLDILRHEVRQVLHTEAAVEHHGPHSVGRPIQA